MQANNFYQMEIFYNTIALKEKLQATGIKKIGLVPTMGALHQGHISLIEKSAKENEITVVSIFVNPTQFDNPEDLKKYPKTFDRDIELLERIEETVFVFHPEIEDIYTNEIKASNFNFGGLEFEMEGRYRTGHFDGVGTIVKQLLEIVSPHKAYFGEKDYQQLLIVKALVKNQKIPVKIIGCAIYREKNGLAMSSRNERLSPDIRDKASLIFKTLKTAKKKFGTESALKVKDWVAKVFEANNDFTLEYFEIADALTLKTVTRKSKNKKYRAFIAVYANDIRLIDNIALN